MALSPQQGRWKRAATRVAREVLAPRAAEIDRQGRYPRENVEALGAEGLLGLLVPEELGGPGGDVVASTLVTEALAQGCASTAMAYHMHASVVPMLASLATGVQVDRFVRPLLERGAIFSLAMTEPGSGSRLWHMQSFARRDGAGYVIDSFKSFVTGAGESDFYAVALKTSESSPADEMSVFVIDGGDPGVQPKGGWDAMGMRGSASGPLHFAGCRVDAAALLGRPTSGFSYMLAYTMPIYHVGLAAVYLGIARGAFEGALEHVKTRVHTDTGNPLSTVESVQRYIAEMRCRIDQTSALLHRVARLVDDGLKVLREVDRAGMLDELLRKILHKDDFYLETAEAKLAACETAIAVTHRAVQVCGGLGYKRGSAVERCFRDGRAGSVMAPNDDSLKLLVGQQVLGLPFPWEREGLGTR